jgi:uncharacterized protein (DUF1684 family)
MSLTLLDWRRTVAAMYAAVRDGAERDPEATLAAFRADRERLIRDHPQSPIRPEKRASFGGLGHWPRDPTLRFEAVVEPAEPERLIAHSLDGDPYPLDRIGRVRLAVGELEVYWIEVYGGGVFVPFRDATSGTESYGAGRYLLDTIKGADLGGDAAGLVVDFNYAYHPSCTYDPIWNCPLAPPANRLSRPIRAGERLPTRVAPALAAPRRAGRWPPRSSGHSP